MRFSLFSLLLLLVLTGCYKDFEDLTTSTSEREPNISFGALTASAKGRVITEDGTPIAGARISNFNRSVTTDANGNYDFSDFLIDVNGGTQFYISGSGYYDEWRKFYPEGGSLHLIDIVMNSRQPQGIINGATGGTFTTNGVSLTIEPGSVMASGGGFYNGDINVTMHYDDPSSFSDIAQSAANVPAWYNGSEMELATFGMVEVEMTDDQGRRVWLNQEQPATLAMPIPPSLQNTADDSSTVLFWELIELQWQFLSQPSVRGGTIRANIFGSGLYNCDVPYERATICGQLVTPEGIPLVSQPFALSIADGAFVFSFYSDNRGRFCARVARDQVLQIRIPDPCNPDEILLSIDLGPYPEGPTEIGNIVLDLPLILKPIVVTKCEDGSPFTDEDGLLWISGFGNGIPYPLNGDGISLLPLPNCGTLLRYQIQAVDDDMRQTSTLTTVINENNSPLNLTVCGDLEADEFFTATIDGGPVLNMSRGSYLLRQDAEGEQRHQFWGEHVSGTDTTEFFISLPVLEVTSYGAPDATVVGFGYQPGLSYRLLCDTNCAGMTIDIIATGPGLSWVEGTFSYLATQTNIIDGAGIAADLPITGTFRLNR
ncbi:carboxypeptidase-like regulatory domain-containing protein [Neolewinella persica]|uniref:carboxypeptidase-like regulatory domain-containing protein n=1 Tax=Neolewinella persica TaxID=70998 RepID=UPI00035DFB76|nr:carboxypeptidase-like regulatory domain-containing protein [Neolewinella persica]